MKDYLASGNNCNICKFVMPNFYYQGLSNNSRFLVLMTGGLQLILGQISLDFEEIYARKESV